MKFTYRFNNILNLKEKLEENKKHDFAVSKRKYEKENEKLNTLLEKKASLLNRWREVTEGNNVVTIKVLQNSSMDIKLVEDLVEKQRKETKIKEENLNKCKKQLIEAKKQRKIFDKLKEKDYEEFNALISKNEASLVDQLVSYKNTVKRGG